VSRPPLPGGPYLVVGLARSGLAAAHALLARGETVLGADRDTGRGAELERFGVELVGDGVGALERVACVIKSPGVPAQDATIAAARTRGIPVLGELELAWRLLPSDFVAVTGTNGKTTTVELIGAIHRSAGLPVVVAGNVGLALSRLVSAPPHGDGPLDPATTVVCEASSFQLEDAVEFAPQGAVLLNIAPDHLDRHGGMAAYVAAKMAAFARQGPADLAVIPDDGPEVPGAARRLRFGSTPAADVHSDGASIWWRGTRVIGAAEIALRGPHNVKNAMAAAAVTLGRGVALDAVADALRGFRGVPHRLEEVATRDGVLYVNDSKATNVASALVGLRSFAPGTVHAILGGQGKGEDYAPLRAEVARRARAVYLIGAEAPAIASALAGLPLVDAGTLEGALVAARAAARRGEVVLLSPACTSYDQFRDYEARGDEFRRLVLAGD
jgi:UDP-N-acetylmuramoylalanine--D-glutamate ligase